VAFDSGALAPMSSQHNWFSSYNKLDPPIQVKLDDNSYILAIGEGCMHITMTIDNQEVPAIIQKVLHVPDLHGNLLLVSSPTKNGFKIIFEPNNCQIINRMGQVVRKAYLHNNLYVLHAHATPPEHIHISTIENENLLVAKGEQMSKANAKIWHRRLGHVHVDAVLEMVQKEMVKGMTLVQDKESEVSNSPCEPCLHGKHHRNPIPTETSN
jgi:hypothetical protein